MKLKDLKREKLYKRRGVENHYVYKTMYGCILLLEGHVFNVNQGLEKTWEHIEFEETADVLTVEFK